MDYRGIYTPSDQRSRPWRGQSYLETREDVLCAPSILRAHVFFDAQNLFHSVKTAYGYRYPNYDPVALAHLECRRLRLRCDGIHFYTGVHDVRVNPFWHAFWTRKLQVLGTRDVDVFSRRLAYTSETFALPDGSPTTVRSAREKGIDVRIALDMVRLAREEAYDVAILFSSDQDLSEAIAEIHRIRADYRRWIKIYSAYPVADDGTHAPAVKGAAAPHHPRRVPALHRPTGLQRSAGRVGGGAYGRQRQILQAAWPDARARRCYFCGILFPKDSCGQFLHNYRHYRQECGPCDD